MKKANLKQLRQAFLLSQFELSAAVGIPRYKIQLHEQGVLSLTYQELENIAQKLNCKLTEDGYFKSSFFQEET